MLSDSTSTSNVDKSDCHSDLMDSDGGRMLIPSNFRERSGVGDNRVEHYQPRYVMLAVYKALSLPDVLYGWGCSKLNDTNTRSVRFVSNNYLELPPQTYGDRSCFNAICQIVSSLPPEMRAS